jgi:hypothetical protein
MDTKTQRGYLILADISGFSTFFANSELEHAHDIFSELLDLVLKRLTAIFTLSKLKGDAIFAYTLMPLSAASYRSAWQTRAARWS